MSNQKDFKSIVLWIILGVVVYTLLKQAETILSLVFPIIGAIIKVNPYVFFSLELIPRLLIIAFWIILLFGYMIKFDGSFTIEKFPRKFALFSTISTLVLFIIISVLRAVYTYAASSNYDYFRPPSHNFYLIRTYIYTGTSFVELLIIAIGFIVMVTKIPNVYKMENKI